MFFKNLSAIFIFEITSKTLTHKVNTMKNYNFKRFGLLLFGVILSIGISFAADFKEVKKDIKHSIENIQFVPSAGIEFNQVNVLIHNSGDLKISANEVGELKFGEVNARLDSLSKNVDLLVNYMILHAGKIATLEERTKNL